jgi:hypothetical protein
MNSRLAALLPRRTGGATNLRGIIFQLLVALKRALDLYDPSCAWEAVGIEQFEDVDLQLKPVQLIGSSSTRYCQVKTAEGTWYPNQLEKPLRSFLEILLADQQALFSLVMNFTPTGQLLEIAGYSGLKPSRQRRIRDKFRSLCHDAVRASKTGKVPALSISDRDADTLLERLSFEIFDEDTLLNDIKQAMGQHFNIAGDRVEEYLDIFFARFAAWSRDRQRITRADLDNLRDNIEANRAFEVEFAARGKMLIRKLDWTVDASEQDFFQGKATRPGHIALALDVPRLHWQKRINQTLDEVGIVVVRSSSGQGKSTLAYRFAYDHWPPEHTFVLQGASTSDEADLVNEYLRARVQTYGLPTFLLIDNANRRTQYWSEIAQECARLGVKTLVTLRQEDWARFARQSLFAFKVVEPSLDRAEAREIFNILKQRNLVDRDVASADFAYERIGKPYLLMEFIYLVTQGQMLEDRLREQLVEIQQHEEPIKLEIVRRVALADVLGAPVMEDELFKDLRSEWGAGAVAFGAGALLRSLDGEYLQRHSDMLSGLHWVRSDHLVRLLHDGFPTLASTALSVLSAVSTSHLPQVIGEALTRPVMKEQFMQGLIKRAQTVPLHEIVSYLEGVFEAGEIRFFEANRALFDEAYSQLGEAGPFMLAMDHPPSLERKFLTEISDIFPDDRRSFRPLLSLSERFQLVDRGYHDCQQFLKALVVRFQGKDIVQDIAVAGDLMAWSAWCGITWPNWGQTRSDLLTRVTRWDFNVDALCRFHEGLWLFDRKTYRKYVDVNLDLLRDYLQWQLDCLHLELGAVPDEPQDKTGSQGELSLEFLTSGLESAGKDAVDRLIALYSLFPFYECYRSKAFWSLDLPMFHDPSVKAMSQEFQYLKFYIARNSFWGRLVDSRYSVQTYYEFARAWHDARRRTVAVLAALADRLELMLAGKAPDLGGTFTGESDITAFHQSLLKAPEPPEQTPPDLRQDLKAAKEWNNHMTAWLSQFTPTAVYFQQHKQLPMVGDDASHAAHLTLHNLRDAAKDLSSMQAVMRKLFEAVGDVFETKNLEGKETEAFKRAVAAEEVWLEDRPAQTVTSLEEFLAEKHEQQWAGLFQRLKVQLSPLEERGMEFIYPRGIFCDFPLSYLPLGFVVSDPCDFMAERDGVIEAIDSLRDVVSFGCLIPMMKDKNDEVVRFLPGGYRFSLQAVGPDDDIGRQTREAVLLDVQELPEDIYELLPDVPLRESPHLRVKATLHRILFEMESFARQAERIERMASIPGSFTARAYNKNRLRLLAQVIGEGINFGDIQLLLEEYFGHKSELPEYGAATGYLEVAQLLNQAQNELPISEEQESLTSVQEVLWLKAAALKEIKFDLVHECILALTKA